MTRQDAPLSETIGAIADIIACPQCHEDLVRQQAMLSCKSCGCCYPQTGSGYVQLMPTATGSEGSDAWQSRQDDMRVYYDDMISHPSNAAETILSEGATVAPLLARFTGRILDIGGGAGLMRLFTPNADTYVVIEPEAYWFDAQWQRLHTDRQRSTAALALVEGVGEALPFRTRTFDGAISLWSLNHARQPSKVMAEAARVLKPGAPFTLLLEDMEPGPVDVLRWTNRGTCTAKQAAHLWARQIYKLFAQVGPWYVAPDHIRITEADMAAWTDGCFVLEGRQWIGRYLALEFRRR